MAKKLKILIVSLDYKPNTGGIAEYIHNLAEVINDKGALVEIISYKTKDSEDFDQQTSLKITRWPEKSKYKFLRLIKSFIYEPWLLQKKLNSSKYDVIIFNSVVPPTFLLPFSCIKKKPRLVTIIYGLDFLKNKNTVSKYLKKFLLEISDQVFTISQYTKKEAQNTYSIKASKIKIIQPALSDSFKQRGIYKIKIPRIDNLIQPDDKIILALGRLIERKGFDIAIQAMEIVKNEMPNAVLIVAGNGPDLNRLKKIAREKGVLDTRVKFLGYVTDKEKHYLYSKAAVYVMPSRELENGDVEGFGITFLEANAYGVPVIGGRSGGILDAVIDGKTGYLVDPLDKEEIASKILHILKNKSIASKINKQALARTEELTWEATGDNFYKEMVKLTKNRES